jgi:hypothetical protein
MPRRILAVMLASLLAGMPLFGQAPPLGVVTQTTSGHINTGATAVGTTVYNGDRLSTDAGGTLGVRFGPVQLVLPENSALFVGQDGPALIAVIQSGSVAFTVEPGGVFQATAADVRVRPQSGGTLTVGQVTLEDCAVVVTSRTASLEVTAGKEVKIVDPGQTYRVALNTGCGKHPSEKPIAPAHSRFLLLPIIAGGITVWGIHKALESPDRP